MLFANDWFSFLMLSSPPAETADIVAGSSEQSVLVRPAALCDAAAIAAVYFETARVQYV